MEVRDRENKKRRGEAGGGAKWSTACWRALQIMAFSESLDAWAVMESSQRNLLETESPA